MNIVYFVMQQTMFFAIPLLIVAIGGMYSERSGVVNIALEGIMIMGALAGTVLIHLTDGVMSGQGLLMLSIVVSGLVGGLFSLLHALAAIQMKADQTISGTALNLFAPAFAVLAARNLLGVQQVPFKNTFMIDRVPVLGDIPVIGPMFFQKSYLTTYIGLAIFVLAALVINKTRFGLRLRACGEHPGAADAVGVKVYHIRYAGVFISGLLAGIGGLVFIIPTSTVFNASVAGYGFLALAVLIFGQWRSKKIFYAAFFFAIMKTLASAYSVIPLLKDLPLPNEMYKLFPYLATLVVLTFISKNSQAPRASGVPYDKGSR